MYRNCVSDLVDIYLEMLIKSIIVVIIIRPNNVRVLYRFGFGSISTPTTPKIKLKFLYDFSKIGHFLFFTKYWKNIYTKLMNIHREERLEAMLFSRSIMFS